MIEFCNSKINLGLRIIGKRPDGYHNLETVFYPVACMDLLEVVEGIDEPGKKVKIIFEGLPIEGSPENNLISKAYHLLDAQFDLPPVTFCLFKKIPMGAGLGGGSSDGAFALKLLNRLFGLQLSKEQLITAATKLGSDCAFFIENKAAFATGRGEILSPVSLDLSAYCLVLVKPDIHVSTATAFSQVGSTNTFNREFSLSSIVQKPIEQWKDLLINEFEKSVFEVYPRIEEIKNQLYQSGALYASMSGSGSAVFGLFRSKPNLRETFQDCDYFEV